MTILSCSRGHRVEVDNDEAKKVEGAACSICDRPLLVSEVRG